MIVIRKASKSYDGETLALEDLSLVIPAGDFAFLVGPNGAGKSTLLKLLTREEGLTSGAILCSGRNLADLEGSALSEHRRTLGSVFQDPRLVAAKTVVENVMLPVEADGKAEEARSGAERAMELAQVDALRDRFPDELSGGQQQRVAIARALVNNPSAILADEPTGNLSPVATEEVLDVLERINELGITVILATHNLEAVDEMARRVITLDEGRLVDDALVGRFPDFLRKRAA